MSLKPVPLRGVPGEFKFCIIITERTALTKRPLLPGLVLSDITLFETSGIADSASVEEKVIIGLIS
jgi:hypothetical protein